MGHEIWFERVGVRLIRVNLQEFLKKKYMKGFAKGSNNRGVWLSEVLL